MLLSCVHNDTSFHKDAVGGYNYGYATPTSSKQEFKTADGIVQGTYSYVDANGITQTVNYVSDAEGFKVAATNLPKAPVAAPVEPATVGIYAGYGNEAKPVAVVAPTAREAKSALKEEQEERKEKQLILTEDGKIRPETIPFNFNTQIFDSIGVFKPGVIAPTTYNVEKDDDMEVVAAEPETVIPEIAPFQYYAPQQGYQQVPVAPAVVQAPAPSPVAYYAPYDGYGTVNVPQSVPVTYQTASVVAPAPVVAPVVAPAPSHSQFHAQVIFV